MKPSAKRTRGFLRDRGGNVALITAIVIFPLLFYCVGIPIDLARQVQLRSTLQNIADDAALAGSSVIGDGGTAAQACTAANAYVKAAAAQLSVPYSALTSPHAAPNFATTANLFGATLGCSANAPNTTSLAQLENTSPTQVSVAISATLPTIFLAAVKPSLPVSVSAATVGPGNFVTVCLKPQSTTSADYNALYYYGYDPNTSPATLFNVGANGTPPTAFTEGSANDPSVLAGAPEFLEDDLGNGPTYNITPATPQCTSGFYKVFVHLPLASRIGVEMASEKGGTYPCFYATVYNANAGVLQGQEWQGGTSNACMASGNRPTPGTGGAKALTNFSTDAYGTTVFTTNRYYSTDYATTLNTSTTATVYSGFGLVGSAGNFSASNQSLVADTLYKPAYPHFAIAQTNANEMFFNSRAQFAQLDATQGYNLTVGSTDLVCMVNNGAPVAPNSTTPYNSLGTAVDFTNISIGAAQQENLVVQNSLQGNAAQCANTIEGNPYQIDPTCAELNGATLTAFWNDMGSPGYDNVNYGDMPYSFACSAGSGIATLDYIRPALSQ
jgi:Flp pilus assembly protein TadG